MELLAKTGMDLPDPKLDAAYASAKRSWSLYFLRSPMEVLGSEAEGVTGLKLAINRSEAEITHCCPTSNTFTLLGRLGFRQSFIMSNQSSHNHYLFAITPVGV